MTTLTERYVQDVVRRVPADQREDIADELRATIADTIDGRGATETAERDVLTEMGDPAHLAARYTDRPMALIGPGLYPTYIRLLKLLLTLVLPIVVLALVGLAFIDGEGSSFGTVIGTVITGIITVGAHMFAWTTIIFAVLERIMPGVKLGTWSVDELPEAPTADNSRTDAVATIVWHVLLLGLIVVPATAGVFPTEGGDRVQVLNPQLWNGWMWPIVAGVAGLIIVGVARLVRRRWNPQLVVAGVIAELLFALPLAWVAYKEELFNPVFLAEVTVYDGLYAAIALVVLGVAAYEIFDRVRSLKK